MLWNKLRRSGQKGLAETLKRSRYALWKNPENLTKKQKEKLSFIEKANKPLYRAYLMKEQLREVFKLKGAPGVKLLDEWCAWAQRSRLEPFVKLAQSIRAHRKSIVAALEHGLSNARVESANTKLRLITRLAFWFHSSGPMIALAMLRLGGLCPPSYLDEGDPRIRQETQKKLPSYASARADHVAVDRWRPDVDREVVSTIDATDRGDPGQATGEDQPFERLAKVEGGRLLVAREPETAHVS